AVVGDEHGTARAYCDPGGARQRTGLQGAYDAVVDDADPVVALVGDIDDARADRHAHGRIELRSQGAWIRARHTGHRAGDRTVVAAGLSADAGHDGDDARQRIDPLDLLVHSVGDVEVAVRVQRYGPGSEQRQDGGLAIGLARSECRGVGNAAGRRD